MEIKRFDSKHCKVLREPLETAIAAAVAPFGLTVKVEGGSYEASIFRPKISLIAAGSNPDREDFELYASMFGLTADDYGAEFKNARATYRLIGIKPNRPKYPFIAERVSDGHRFKFPEGIKRNLERAAPA